jgi:hypothetical protein
MKTLDGTARTVSDVLNGKRYGFDYRQREQERQQRLADRGGGPPQLVREVPSTAA